MKIVFENEIKPFYMYCYSICKFLYAEFRDIKLLALNGFCGTSCNHLSLLVDVEGIKDYRINLHCNAFRIKTVYIHSSKVSKVYQEFPPTEFNHPFLDFNQS